MTVARRQDVARRALSVLAGAALMASVGSNHSISAWNGQLKTTLGYSQAEISLVCSMASFGAYFSVSPGFVYDRIGAHKSILLGGALLSAIYCAIAIGIVDSPSVMHPGFVGMAFAVIGQASNAGVFASLGPNEGIFGEDNRGKIMALQFAAFSAGGAFFALVYDSWFAHRADSVPSFFRFMALVFLAVFMFAWVATYRPQDPTFETTQLKAMEEFAPVSHDIQLPERDGDAVLVVSQSEDITGRALLEDSRFWMLFATVFILVGASLFVMANIAFIVESLGGRKEQVPAMVALFSIGNCLGRVVAGAVSDLVLPRCPRIYFVSIAAVFVAFNHVLLLLLPPRLLIIPIGLTGLADGIMFAVFPVLTRETFGARHFGTNFGLMSIANAAGFPLFFSPIGSYFYKLSSQHINGGDKCIGAHCFQPVFVVVICLSCFALVASLKFAARHHYSSL